MIISCFVKSNFPELKYGRNKYGMLTNQIDDHDFFVGRLLSHGITVFINKKDAKKYVLKENLLAFKYLQLNPTLLVLSS